MPLSLIREETSGPNPVGFWLDSNFWGSGGRGHTSSSSSSSWGPFGGRPSRPRRPQHHRPAPAPRPFRSSPSCPRKKIFVGDQHQCSTGSCEFFVFCWLGGGIVESACGGFLFACCTRPTDTRNTEAVVARVSADFWFGKTNSVERKKREWIKKGLSLKFAWKV